MLKQNGIRGKDQEMRRRRIRKTGKVRRYRCTVSTFHYDPNAGVLREFEVHLRVARPGPIRDNRRTLGRRGLRHLQRMIFMRSGRWIPIGKVKIHYEREQAASRPEHRIAVEARSMKYQDRRLASYPAAFRSDPSAREQS